MNSRDIVAWPVQHLPEEVSLISSCNVTPASSCKKIANAQNIHIAQNGFGISRDLLHNPESSVADVLANVELVVVHYHPLVVVTMETLKPHHNVNTQSTNKAYNVHATC